MIGAVRDLVIDGQSEAGERAVLSRVASAQSKRNSLKVSVQTKSATQMPEDKDRFAWTTGGNAELRHKRRIDTGGSGTVHEVRFSLTLLTFL
jgi:hypothetical protein